MRSKLTQRTNQITPQHQEEDQHHHGDHQHEVQGRAEEDIIIIINQTGKITDIAILDSIRSKTTG
jgi:hypothetical protein